MDHGNTFEVIKRDTQPCDLGWAGEYYVRVTNKRGQTVVLEEDEVYEIKRLIQEKSVPSKQEKEKE